MGQKVHPYSFRLGVATDWKSKWFSTKDYAKLVLEDSNGDGRFQDLSDWLGHKLGEFAPTRTFRGHAGTAARTR